METSDLDRWTLAKKAYNSAFTRGYEQARKEDLKAVAAELLAEHDNSSTSIGVNMGVTRALNAIRALVPKAAEEKGGDVK